MPGICNLIKPAAMEKLMPFPAQIHPDMSTLTPTPTHMDVHSWIFHINIY